MRHVNFVALPIKVVLLLALILLLPSLIYIVTVQASPETIVKVEPCTSSAIVGETFTINITVVDVQNLYGIEVMLCWNASMLQVVNVNPRLGVESHPDGVLHELLPSAPIFVVENNVAQEQGQYRLAATSTAPAPSFNGSGNIVIITFNTLNSGDSKLDLETQLYDRPPPNEASMPIDHISVDGFITAIIPEFSSSIILIVLLIVAVWAGVLSRKISGKILPHSRFRSEQFRLNIY